MKKMPKKLYEALDRIEIVPAEFYDKQYDASKGAKAFRSECVSKFGSKWEERQLWELVFTKR